MKKRSDKKISLLLFSVWLVLTLFVVLVNLPIIFSSSTITADLTDRAVFDGFQIGADSNQEYVGLDMVTADYDVRYYVYWDVSDIPDGATINSVGINISVDSTSVGASNSYVYSMEMPYTSTSVDDMYADCRNGSAYSTGGSLLSSTGWRYLDLGSDGITDLGNSLSEDSFGVGLSTEDDWEVAVVNAFGSASPPQLIVDYTEAVVDTTAPVVSFETPTLADSGATGSDKSFEVNVSITEANLNEVIYTYNGTNFSLFNDSVVLYYNFDNVSALGESATKVVDVATGDNNGTIEGAPFVNTTDAKYGNCFTFDGSDDSIDAGSNASLDLTGNLAVAVWFKVWNPNTGSGQFIVAKDYNTGRAWGLKVDVNKVVLEKGGAELSFSTSTIAADTWYYAVETFDGTNWKMYLNGVLEDSDSSAAATSAPATKVMIGSRQYAGARNFFGGNVDEVMILNRSLSQVEINQLYFSNLYKYDTDKWNLYINQSQNVTTGLGDGAETYEVIAIDDSLAQATTGERTVYIGDAPAVGDTIAPSFEEIPGNQTYEYKLESLDLDINATDETALDNYSVNDTTNFKINASGYLTNNTDLNLGTYWINITINDTSNNLNSTIFYVLVSDKTAPAVTVSSPPSGKKYYLYGTNLTTNVSINFSATDVGGIDTYWFTYNGNVTNITSNDSIRSLADGNYILTAYVNDTSGNLGMAQVSFQVIGEEDYYSTALDYYLKNLRCENCSKAVNFTHLEISDLAPWDSLVAYYSFDADDNSTAYDFSGNNNHGTYNGNAYSGKNTTELYDDNLNLDGVNDYVKILNNDLFDFTGAFTFSVWAKPTAANVDGKIVYTYSGQGYNFGLTTSKWYFYTWAAGGNIGFSSDDAATRDWQHVVGTRLGNGTMLLYVDGVKQTNTPTSSGGIDSSDPVYIGVDKVLANDFNGSLDEVMIFNTSLTDAQILEIYNNQSDRFKKAGQEIVSQKSITSGYTQVNVTSNYESEGSSNLSASVGYWDETKGYKDYDLGEHWLELDGVGDWMTATDNDIANGTWCMWINERPDCESNGGFLTQSNAASWNIKELEMYSGLEGSCGKILAQYGCADGSSGDQITSSRTGLNDNQWHHVCFRANNTEFRLFIDGEMDSAVPLGSPTPCAGGIRTSEDVPIYIGTSYPVANWQFNGTMDEVMIFNRSLTSSEIKHLYTLGRDIGYYEDPNLVNWWGFDRSFADKKGSNDGTGAGNAFVNSTTNGLVAYWHLDNNSVYGESETWIYDFSGNGNNGSGTSSIWNSSGVYGGSFEVASSSANFFTIPYSQQNLNITGNLTLASWVRIDGPSYGAWQQIFGNCQDYAPGTCWGLGFPSYQFLGILTRNQTDYFQARAQTSAAALDGKWHFMVGTLADSPSTASLKFYLDGVIVDHKNLTLGVVDRDFSRNVTLGGAGANSFNGSIDEVMIFNRSLSAYEIKELYNKGRAKFEMADYQEVSGQNAFLINSTSTNIFTDYLFESGNASTFFYTPLLYSASARAVDLVYPLINFTFPTQDNFSVSNSQDSIFVNVSVTELFEDTVTFELWNSTALVNRTDFTDGTRTINWTDLTADKTYYFNVTVNDTQNNVNFTATRIFIYDTTAPSGSLTNPLDNIFSSNWSFNFTATIADALSGILNATLNIFNSTGDLFNSSVVSGFTQGVASASVGVVVTVVEGVYTWFYEIYDYAGNLFTTSNYTLIIDNTYPQVDFQNPTPSNNSGASGNVILNVSINETNLANVSYYWNGSLHLKRNSSYSSTYDLKNVSSLLEGLVLFMSFENNSNYDENGTYVVDYSGYGNNGTITGDGDEINLTGGRYGGGLGLNGSGEYVNCSISDSLNLTGELITLSSWIKYNVTGSAAKGIVTKDNPGVGRGYGLYLADGDNRLVSSYMRIGGTWEQVVSTTRLNDNKWHNVAVNYNGSLVNLYIDGVEEDSEVASGDILANSDSLFIGAHNMDLSAPYTFNGSIDDVMVFNRSLDADEIKQLYYSNVRKYYQQENNYSLLYSEELNSSTTLFNLTSTDLDMNFFNLIVNETRLPYSTDSVLYNVSVLDKAGNLNYSETRTLSGNSAPIVSIISQTPSLNNSIDPNVEVVISLNVSDIESNFDSAILQWINSTGTSNNWENTTMENFTVKGRYTWLNASFTLPSYEDNLTYRIWMNDTIGAGGFSSNYTLVSYWDCDWIVTSALGAAAGWDQNTHIGNISINNTGDVQYSSGNCSLDFRLTYDLTERRICFDNICYKPSGIYSVEAGENRTIVLNATFGTEIKEESAVITTSEISARSQISSANTSLSIVSNQQGPYLYQDIITYPTSVYLTSGGNFTLDAYVKNLMGSDTPNENNTAYNVSFNWSLPSFLTNDTGNVTSFYENISDNALHYSQMSVGFSNLAGATSGVHTFYIYSQGYNVSGDLIEDTSGNNLFSDSVSINFLCYGTSDGVYVTSCGSLDGDYVAPVTTSTTTTTASGGGGGGGGGQITESVSSRADFQLVRGKENQVEIEFKNRYENDTLTDLKFEVESPIAKYINLRPKNIGNLPPGTSIKIILEITSPSYIELGKQEVQILITGKKGASNYREFKQITLEIHDISSEDAQSLLDESEDLVRRLNEANLSYDYVSDLLNESLSVISSFDYETVQNNYKLIEEQVSAALTALETINELYVLLEVAKEKGIDTSNSLRLVKLAELSLDRREFLQASKRAKEAQVTYALEVKGEFGRITYYVQEYPQEISLGLIFLALFSFGSYKFGRMGYLNRRIRKLKEEEQILSQLIEVIQIDTFQNKKMSMEEYQTALEEYQKKLSGVIEDLIEVENARAHLLKFTSKEKQLRIERKRVIEMVEDLQRNYLEKGKLETRSYELRLESYNKKLTDIDERLAVLESRMALRKKFNFFGWGKKPKKKSQGKKGKKK